MEVTAEQVKQTQGTRLQEMPPWMSYAASLEEKLDPKLQSEIDDYAKHRHEKTSSQNQEELARWHEGNCEIAKQYQWVTPAEYADAGPRIGKIIHSSDLITILRKKCGLSCWYRQHPHPDKATLLVQPNGFEPPQVACWVQLGWMPEYTIMRFDDWGVPQNEKYRGWRTVLLDLILKGHLTQERAKRVFGEATGPACNRYNQILFGLRNTLK